MKFVLVLASLLSAATAVKTKYSFCALTSEGSVAKRGTADESVAAGETYSFSYRNDVLAYSYEVCCF